MRGTTVTEAARDPCNARFGQVELQPPKMKHARARTHIHTQAQTHKRKHACMHPSTDPRPHMHAPVQTASSGPPSDPGAP
eukprot:1145401-Pelagomonas_calceolata.AAC.11